jgi:hypothetical protein
MLAMAIGASFAQARGECRRARQAQMLLLVILAIAKRCQRLVVVEPEQRYRLVPRRESRQNLRLS